MPVDPPSDGDGECFTAQLDGSDSSPRAPKVIFIPLSLDVDIDDRLTNSARVKSEFRELNQYRAHRTTTIGQPIDDTATSSPPAVLQAEMGRLHVHLDFPMLTHQYRIFGAN